ncbi:hypothetical protein SLS62_002166 [Diatrype stigma]|uniref:Uncharacterized protein n=1 Tax=Diatrype stigma TaxID=117547 RepID=A0AAN9V7B3_9PEZI
MDQLAPELLGAIVDLLEPRELACLSACSKALQKFIDPVLYGTESSRARAMRWACAHGNLGLIRKAIAHGAPPSAIEARPGPGRSGTAPGASSVLLTVYLAAKHQQAGAFLLLLSLGARMDLPWVRNQVKKTTKWLARHPELLQAYLAAGCDAQVRAVHCPEVAWPLVPAVRAGAPPALVRLLVERGASPNQVVGGGRGRAIESPLSAAISRCSRELVDVLVEMGADIHGREILPPSRARAPTQIPLFAAAKLMATSPEEGRLMMSVCLQYGADINQHACFSNSNELFYWITPLLVYLDSVPWGDAAADRQLQKEALGVISYFFDQGATDSVPEDKRPRRPRRLSTCDHLWIETPYPIEMLLDRWKLYSLTQDRYFSIIELLAQRTNLVDLTIRLVRKHSYRFKPTEPWSADVRAGWRRLLDVLLAQQDVNINLLLFNLIVDKGESIGYNNPSVGLGVLYHMVIESLLDRGADINTLDNPKGTTAMHELCRFYSMKATDPAPIFDCGLNDPYLMNQRYLLFDLLMERGANPTIATGGKTAVDVLLSTLDKATERAKPFLLELAAIMRGEDESESAAA